METLRTDSCLGRRPGRQTGNCGEPDWRAWLPRTWRVQVVAPIWFKRFRDYELLAERVLGYGDEESPCYCEHYFVLPELRSDDDEDYYIAPAYSEHMAAWKLVDGCWLIHRRILQGEDCSQGQAFFSFADEMPR